MDAKDSPFGNALSTATATLAVIAGAISVVSGFAYLIAYRYLTGYFYGLGCEWAIDLYPPTQVIQTAAPVAVAAAGVAFGIWNGYPGYSEFQGKVRTIACILIAAAVFYGIHILIEKYSTAYKSHFIWLAALLAFIGTLVTAIKIVQKIMIAQGVAWGSFILIILAAYALYAFSYDRGKSHAQETLSMENGRGSSVTLEGATEPHRLARIVPYDRALVFTEKSAEKRTFRVVSVTEIRFENVQRRR